MEKQPTNSVNESLDSGKTQVDNGPIIKLGVSKYKNIMGITCYMNSILHILQQTPLFIHYISQFKFKDVLSQKVELLANKNLTDNKVAIVKTFVIFELFRLFKTSL